MEPINIYTDGSSRGNPGPGGYGVILTYKQFRKELSCGYKKTTNNRMELLAVIVGLEAIKWKNIDVNIYSDSTYVVKAVTDGWLNKWQVKGLHKQKNADLWRRFLLISKNFKLNFFWIKGHAGHPENERCDKLAVEAAMAQNLIDDEGFENL